MDITDYTVDVRNESRKEYLREIKRQDSDINEILIEFKHSTDRIVERASNNGEIPDVDAVLSPFSKALSYYLGLYTLSLLEHNINASKVAVDDAKKLVDIYGSTQYNSIVAKRGNAYIKDIENNFLRTGSVTDGITVGNRIKTLEGSTLLTTKNILKVGIRDGKSSVKVAKEITNLIKKDDRKLWTSPYDWYRDRFGFKKAVTPTNVKAGSVDYNAMRIARTEINNTWRTAHIELHKGNPYIQGWNWILSATHTTPDICDEYADGSPYLNATDIPTSHPHCLCDVVPHLLPPSEVVNYAQVDDLVEESI